MRLVRSRVGGGTSAAILALAMIACAKGTDSGVGDDGSGVVGDASRDVFVIPDDSSTDKDTGPRADGAVDAGTDTGVCGKTVVINEVQTAGSGPSSELVELYNPGTCAVALDGWEIRYASAAGGPGPAGHKFGSGVSLAAKAYLVLKTSDSTWTAGMAATSGQLGLFDKTAPAAGAVRIDGVAYGSITAGGAVSYGEKQAAPSPATGGSIGRSPNGVDTDDNNADFKASATTSFGSANN